MFCDHGFSDAGHWMQGLWWYQVNGDVYFLGLGCWVHNINSVDLGEHCGSNPQWLKVLLGFSAVPAGPAAKDQGMY